MSPYLKFLSWIKIEEINWTKLSENKNACYILEKNLDKINNYNQF